MVTLSDEISNLLNKQKKGQIAKQIYSMGNTVYLAQVNAIDLHCCKSEPKWKEVTTTTVNMSVINTKALGFMEGHQQIIFF